MARGGKRSGAGRKPDLDPEIVEHIRRDCEQRASIIKHGQAAMRLERRLAKRGFARIDEEDEIDILQRVPLHERPTVARFGHVEITNNHFPEELSDEAQTAIEWMRSNAVHFRLYREPLPQLAKGRQEVIDAVARDWNVSPRMVRSIWEKKPDV